AEITRYRCQSFAASKPLRAQCMRCQVTVAEPKPVRSAKTSKLLQKAPAFLGNAPAGCRIGDARKGVHDSIKVGRNVQTQMLEIVAGIDDDREIAPKAAGQAVRQLGAADAAR